MLGISLILVVLAVAVFSSYQQYRWYQENKLDQRVAQQFDLNAQQQVAMAQQVASLQQQLSAQRAAASAHQQDSEAMAQQVKVLKQKITRLKSELTNMGDSVESLDGRVVAIAPLHQFGSDNTIHGPEWPCQSAVKPLCDPSRECGQQAAALQDRRSLRPLPEAGSCLSEERQPLSADLRQFQQLPGGRQRDATHAQP